MLIKLVKSPKLISVREASLHDDTLSTGATHAHILGIGKILRSLFLLLRLTWRLL